MAIKKTRYRPPVYVNGNATYPDIHHFETSGDQVKIDDAGEYFTAEDTEGVLQEVGIHIADIDNPHEVTAEQAGALSTTDAGDRTYTEQNYIADAEPLTTSIDKLDMQLKDTADLVSTNKDDLVAHKTDIMPHQITNFKTGKTYRYGYQISADGIPQVISEEVV